LLNHTTRSTTAATTTTQHNPEPASTAKCITLMAKSYDLQCLNRRSAMPARRPTHTFQIRVIGPTDHTRRILAHLAEHAAPLFGPHINYRTQVRSARRAGHIRAYFTVTSKEAG
jgi:hypothetical protein